MRNWWCEVYTQGGNRKQCHKSHQLSLGWLGRPRCASTAWAHRLPVLREEVLPARRRELVERQRLLGVANGVDPA